MEISTFLNIAGGVALFLYGIKLMSSALQSIAGDKMRKLIGTLTKTPLRGIFVGILVTVLIQSSSGTTVMTVSFVNTGLLNLNQAIGIIMGANIGTTVTAQIIAFKIEAFALPLVALGMILSILAKNKKQLSYIASGIIGLGLLFLGMQTMSSKEVVGIISKHSDLIMTLSQNPLTGVLTGMILTILIQSSAATIGLVMAIAANSNGLIGLDAAIPIILGDNIGTTFTAIVAAMGATRPAKQAAAAHVLFNLIGTVIFLLAFPLYREIVVWSSPDIGRQIANAHTIFNILNTIIFFPFVSLLAKLISTLIPLSPEDKPEDVMYLDPNLISISSASAVEAVKDELMHMGRITQGMFDLLRTTFFEYDSAKLEERRKKFDGMEESVNKITSAISGYSSEIWQRGVSDEISTVLGCYVNASLDLERIGDRAENLIERCDVMDNYLSADAIEEFRDMFETTKLALDTSLESMENENPVQAWLVIQEIEKKVDDQERRYRQAHIDRLNRGECDPEKGVNFITLLSNLERISDHSNNIAGYTLDISRFSKKEVGAIKS
ncbi:MAG: Na/Pi cotransporter family protein [Synergistales bacterium]|nr:Na/Pi cotransporter family protein [Synergistales bacterium]MDY6405190.1 Na/Pi cotransporter family protein [Synergistales bacterium]MDY6410040.1 Na/Pi cotransporter family protein [Synergistales bacterium]MDY6414476.1 Na/Pi cotransporter family protein [Synergistales bacterium]MDY6421802.1 Na/Pi cotransporter family protein [Synergistales bacterium]